ncbi:hypothetical protein EDD37DRAFT_216208 [Exophiala viscosa]|uniref:uncharacterized protein n=1 Tax=Exophiala viscosa TaxID=2486360 RepID=UPI00219C7BA5|nr:hypothetical protein EDD37DRAFT_216208 [Exophiala viscosa]
MADALCGPSNPLQNLQKHTQIDRTLQQDRLVSSRQSPAQGFRTADPRAGSLDADFHAFENASPSPFQFEQPNFANAGPAFAPQPPSAPAGWAADFQRLKLHDHPLPAGQFRTEAPLIKSTTGGWQNEFMRQRSSASTPISQGKQAIREPSQMNMFAQTNYAQQPFQGYQSYGSGIGMGMQTYQEAGFQQAQAQPQQMTAVQNVQLSDVDFDAAFQEAMSHAQEMDNLQLRDTNAQPLETSSDLHQDQQHLPSEIKIGSDAIHYIEQSERTLDQDIQDADELARTAGQLLHNVQHDTSDKFQNSQFLDLMRKLRDREVEVQNNDLQFVNTATTTSTSTNQIEETRNNTTWDKMSISEGEMTAHRSREIMQQQQQRQQEGHFDFPNMDSVYRPDEADFSERPSFGVQSPPYTTYGFEDDQYPSQSYPQVARQPQRQTDELHPGGRWYPDQSPSSLEKRISMSEFEYTDESAGLARRFVR